MKFYDVSNTENSLVHECWDLCDATITDYPLASVTRRFNIALGEIGSAIINADGTHQYDDTNYTDNNRGPGNLVEGQEKYSFASEYLQIEAIDILGLDGVYHRIKPIDPNDDMEQSLDEIYGVDSSGNPNKGFPEVFDIVGDTIRLYPAPTATAVTLASGLRITFKREPSFFTVTDTTKEPGIAINHSVLAYKSAIPYCAKYKPDRVTFLRDEVARMTKEIIDHYCFREKTRPAQITMKEKSFE